jgi:hypothetical protein
VAYIFWALVIALTVNAFRIHFLTLKAAKAALLPAKVVPYTVVPQEFHLQRDGTAVPSFKLTQARRSDGSRASEMTSSNPASPSSERISDFSSGKKMYVMQHLRLDPTEAATLEAALGGAPRNPRPTPGSQGIIALRLKVTKRKH